MAVGTILGSNKYSIPGVGDSTALNAPGMVTADIVSFDNLVIIGVSLALVAVARTRLKIAR